MTITTTKATSYTGSPVFIIEENGFMIKMALTSKGDIYRLLSYYEHPVDCPPTNVTLSELTFELIEDWRKFRAYAGGYRLQKLALVQKYTITLQYGSIERNPLYTLNEGRYYDAEKALEYYNKSEDLRNSLLKEQSVSASLRKQLRVVQSKLKVPAKMAEMNCNIKEALAYILGGKRYEDYLTALFYKKIVHPNGYTGTGRYTSRGGDKATAISEILTDAGIKHTTGNDAPKGGFSGNFIKIK